MVESWDDILENIKTLESYRTSKSDDTLKFYNDLIKRGTCFLVNKINGQISFSPSRFVGYLNNNREKHISNRSKDGRITNPKIEYILNEKFRIDEGLERAYRIFCFSLGFQPQEKGSFGVTRKYLPNDIFPYIPKDFMMDDIDEIQNQEKLAETEKQQLVNARLGQGAFRESLFKLWKGCSVTGCNLPSMLRASHIKPWRLCDNRERLDPYNGLLLVPNLDLAFDNGLISFDHDGNIILSTSLNEVDAELLGISKHMRILVSSKHKSYLKYHRKNIFKQ